jgi:predicted tellurium resistance membrane protein TerC
LSWVTDPSIWVALATLTALEIVLGVDNIIFISILAGKLPPGERDRARNTGLALAMLTRIALLVSLAWVVRLTQPLFAVWGHDVSGRDMILLAGGAFLLAKSTLEIHEKLEGEEGEVSSRVPAQFGRIVAQIAILDIVFSLDSVITAVGMARQVPVMVAAVVVSVAIMFFYAAPLGAFVDRHPTVKMLALSFLLLIGMSLVADGLHHHVPKGYLYFAMGFAVGVEALNLRLRAKHGEPVKLREPYVVEPERFGGPFDAAGR